MRIPAMLFSASLVFVMILGGCSSSIQVVNNSGAILYKVKVHTVEFAENLDRCGDGCSTGFKKVPAGMNTVSLKETEGDDWIEVGELGPFKKKLNYAVNITKSDGEYCAGLWRRQQTSTTFNDDMTRIFVGKACLHSR